MQGVTLLVVPTSLAQLGVVEGQAQDGSLALPDADMRALLDEVVGPIVQVRGRSVTTGAMPPAVCATGSQRFADHSIPGDALHRHMHRHSIGSIPHMHAPEHPLVHQAPPHPILQSQCQPS